MGNIPQYTLVNIDSDIYTLKNGTDVLRVNKDTLKVMIGSNKLHLIGYKLSKDHRLIQETRYTAPKPNVRNAQTENLMKQVRISETLGVPYIRNKVHYYIHRSNELNMLGCECSDKSVAGKLVIPEGVEVLPERAFYGCLNLKEVQLPKSLLYIHERAFSKTGLTHIEIPDTVKYIGPYAFSCCKDLRRVTLPSTIDKIQSDTFSESGLQEIDIPETVRIIDSNAFSRTLLKNVKLPKKLRKLGYSAFYYCTELESVQLSTSMTCIALDTFNNCRKLKEIIIPQSVTGIYQGAFENCSSLKTVICEGHLKLVSKNAFGYCTSLEKFEVKGSVERYGDLCFYHCANLKSAPWWFGYTRCGYLCTAETHPSFDWEYKRL